MIVRIKEEIVNTVKEYVAEDGKSFETERKCLVYEKFMGQSIYDVIKDYTTFFETGCISKEEILEKLQNNEVPAFCYCLVHTPIPKEKIEYIKIIEKGWDTSGIPNISENNPEPSLFENDWSNAMSGGYGSNGWVEIGTLNYLTKRINYLTEMKKYFEKG